MIQERILELTEYGLVTGLIEPQDKRFTINRLLELFHIDELEDEVTAAYEKRTAMTQESAAPALTTAPCIRTQLDTWAPFSTTTPRERTEFSTVPSIKQPSATRELVDRASGP